jgi:hypothetical protein
MRIQLVCIFSLNSGHKALPAGTGGQVMPNR